MINAPYAEGPLDCKICLIGEAAGRDEVRQQRPFVGRAGHLLNDLLSRAGIVRVECRIENVLQLHPPGDNITPFIDLSKKSPWVTPQAQEHIAALHNRLSACSANVFVPLGNIPLYVLTGLTKITKRRGSILSYNVERRSKGERRQQQKYGNSIDDFDELWTVRSGIDRRKSPTVLRPIRKVIPTIHPSAAFRMYEHRHFIAHDLKRIRRQSEFPEINLIKRDLILEPCFFDVMSYIEKCHHYPIIAFDIEVGREEISHVSLATSPQSAICIPFFDEGREHFTSEQETEIWRALGKLLKDEKIKTVGHQIFFDSTFVYKKYGIIVRSIEDTMVAQKVAFPDFLKGLDFVTSLHCNGEPYYKDDGKKWFKNPFGDTLTFRRYSAMDSAVLMEIFPKQLKVLHELGNTKTYEHQRNLIEPLTFMSAKGIRMNVEGLHKASADAGREIAGLQKELNSIVGFDLNIASPPQVRNYFYIKRGIKPYTKDGSPTVDEKALSRISAKGYKEAEIILELRHLKKMKGTYYDVKLDNDERLHCSYNPVGTKQGRTSSSETIFGTGTNLQNQPEEMLKLMLADPGHIMVSIDMSQAENRVVAYISNEQRMIKAFEEGIDVHMQTASLVFGKPIEEISDDPGSSPLGGGKFSERFWGKKSNHSLNFDLGYRSFAIEYQLPNSEAKYIVERYHTIYPGVRIWHGSIREQLSQSKTLINCLGRHRRFYGRWGDDLFKEAYSFIPQSTVADKLNRDGLCYTYYGQDLFGEVELLNIVHDSILFQVPIDIGANRIYEIIITICRNLESPITWKDREFSIPADAKLGFSAYGDVELKHNDLLDEQLAIEKIGRCINEELGKMD